MPQLDAEERHSPQGQPEQDGGGRLASKNPQGVAARDFLQGECPDDGGDGLTPGVTARADDQGTKNARAKTASSSPEKRRRTVPVSVSAANSTSSQRKRERTTWEIVWPQ